MRVLGRLCFLLLLLFSAPLPGQGDGCFGPDHVNFVRDAGGQDVRLTCVLAYPGGGEDLLLGGVVGGDLMLSRVAVTGEPRWRRSFALPNESTELSTLSQLLVDREGMIAGIGNTFNRPGSQQLYFFRYDPVADRLLYLRRLGASSEGTGIIESGGNYRLVGSRTGEPRPDFDNGLLQLVRAADGLPADRGQLLDLRGDESLLNVEALPNGDFLAAGVVSVGGGGDLRAGLAYFSKDGTQRWFRAGPRPGGVNARLLSFDVKYFAGGIYLTHWGNVGNITGSSETYFSLTRFDLNGEEEWTREYDVQDFAGENVIDMIVHEGSLYAYGFSLVGKRDPYLLRVEEEGALTWARGYVFPGSATVYFRSNQQLHVDDEGINVLATYSYGGDRAREGLVLRLDHEGRLDNPCVETLDLTVDVRRVRGTWLADTLRGRPADLPWEDLPLQPVATDLAVYDDCDERCDDCTERDFARRFACEGSSLLLYGNEVTASGLYFDTIPGAADGCDSILQTEVLFSGAPEVTYAVRRACGLRTAEVTVSASGGVFPYAYRWSEPGVEGQRVNLPGGTYGLTVTDALECFPTVLTVTIEASTGAAIDFRSDAPRCPGEATGRIRLEPREAGGIKLLGDADFTPGAVEGLIAGSYNVILRDTTGCEAFRQITVNPARPVTVAIEGPARVRLGERLRLGARSLTGNFFRGYDWWVDTVACTDCPILDLRPAASGLVNLRATDFNGCVAADSLLIEVVKDAPGIYVPTGFSPNGDDLNDVWEPGLGPDVDEIRTWEVYDRWGKLVWEFDPRSGEVWTGGGHPTGVYTYTLTVALLDGSVVRRAGHVTLVR